MFWDKVKRDYSTVLKISFICVLFCLILIFYLFPRWQVKSNNIPQLPKTEIVLINLPPIIKDVSEERERPAKPELFIPVDDFEMLDSLKVAHKTEFTDSLYIFADSIGLLYLSQLFPQPEIKDFNPDSVRKKLGPLETYKEYLAQKLSDPELYRRKSSSPSDEIVTEKQGRPTVMLQVNLNSLVKSVYNSFKTNREKGDLKIDDLHNVVDQFYILEWLYEEPEQSITQLYKADSIQMKNSVLTLQQSINHLIEHGLVKPVLTYDEIFYKPMYSIEELIAWINRFLTDTPTSKKSTQNTLFDILHQLVTWS